METIGQQLALDGRQLGAGDRARYWREPRLGGLECLDARFVRHRYAPHLHETYVVGVIVEGCESFVVSGVRHYATPGEVCFVHPGEVHDGAPEGGGYVYRMTYPSVALMREIACELTGRDPGGTPAFRATVVRDPEAARQFTLAHRALARGDALVADERYLVAMARLVARHAKVGAAASLGREAGPVARARAFIDARYADEIDLATLAGIAGLSRFHLVRAFRRETGLTPHAYLTDRRVRAAREMLASGHLPGEVAAACGFADQSHLTRAFKARVGVPPGRFRDGSLGTARHAA